MVSKAEVQHQHAWKTGHGQILCQAAQSVSTTSGQCCFSDCHSSELLVWSYFLFPYCRYKDYFRSFFSILNTWCRCQRSCRRLIESLNGAMVWAFVLNVAGCQLEFQPCHPADFLKIVFTASLLSVQHESDSVEKISASLFVGFLRWPGNRIPPSLDGRQVIESNFLPLEIAQTN